MNQATKDRLPHVTNVLHRAGLVDTAWFRQEHLDKGSALHAAARYLDEADLNWNSVYKSVLPRLRQYQLFLDGVKPTILSIEESVVNDVFRYCGRLDRRVIINGREGVLDLKGPARAPWQAVQVAMYAACFGHYMQRWTLHLSDERYQLIQHRSRLDWEAAKAALTLAAWKETNGG